MCLTVISSEMIPLWNTMHFYIGITKHYDSVSFDLSKNDFNG